MHNDYCATTLREGMVEDFASLVSLITGTPVHFGICTCCAEPLPAFVFGERDREEWAHSTNGHYAEMRHVHVDGSSSDCDGRYSQDVTYRIPDIAVEALVPWYRRENAPDFDDLWSYLSKNLPSGAYGDEVLSIQVTSTTVEWGKRTDEGHSGGYAAVCHDPDCAHRGHSQRDYRAESMGY